MGKTKGVIGVFVILLVVVFGLGAKKIKSVKAQISEQKENVAKTNQRLDYLKSLEESLELRRLSGKVLHQLPRVSDPIANKVLIKKFLLSFLSQFGLEAEVEVESERKSKDFPEVIAVNEVPIKIGIPSYSSYKQLLNMLEGSRDFLFALEILTIGGTDVAIPGIFRLQLKYYVVTEES